MGRGGLARALGPSLPCRREILYLVEKHATTVIVGETGSGKSTQIPQYLLESGWCSGTPPPLYATHSSKTLLTG